MQSLGTRLQNADYGSRVFTDRQLASVVGTNDASRYGLVHRGLKDGTLLHLKRGLYALGTRYRSDPIHPFAIAQAFIPGSYISFETSLAYHQWIPEAVYNTASVTPERKTLKFASEAFGHFAFHPVALLPYGFFISVERLKVGKLTAFVASPLRALMDLVALRKIEWTSLEWVTDGMRIDKDHLSELTDGDFDVLANVYKHKTACTFLTELKRAVAHLKAMQRD